VNKEITGSKILTKFITRTMLDCNPSLNQNQAVTHKHRVTSYSLPVTIHYIR